MRIVMTSQASGSPVMAAACSELQEVTYSTTIQRDPPGSGFAPASA